jgi:hypothetical protein
VIPDVVKFLLQMAPAHASKLKVKMTWKRKKNHKLRTAEEWNLEEEEEAEANHQEEEAEEEELQ